LVGITFIRIFDIQTKTKEMEFKILSSSSVSGLNQQIKEHIFDGFKPVGSHQVMVTLQEKTYSGTQERRTYYTLEYSQSMIKE